jgi:hypothetical protein
VALAPALGQGLDLAKAQQLVLTLGGGGQKWCKKNLTLSQSRVRQYMAYERAMALHGTREHWTPEKQWETWQQISGNGPGAGADPKPHDGAVGSEARPAGEEAAPPPGPEDGKITGGMLRLAVPIDSLIVDRESPRVHPERNLEAIKLSLSTYGQVKPIVVRKDKEGNHVIVAGNGTWQAAKALGWTRIAAVVRGMSQLDAFGYSLADNRSGELARWDFEKVHRGQELLEKVDHPMVGWSDDELDILRTCEDWAPPPPKENWQPVTELPLTITWELDQWKVIDEALKVLRESIQGRVTLSNAECLVEICRQWAKSRRPSLPNGQTKKNGKRERANGRSAHPNR